MSPTALSPGTDAPGLLPRRACRNCAKVKERCVPLPDSGGESCQRCHRLKKQCTTPAPVSRVRQHGRKSPRPVESMLVPQASLQTPAPSISSGASEELSIAIGHETAQTPISATLEQISDEKKDAFFHDFCKDMSHHFPFFAFNSDPAAPKTYRETMPVTYAACIMAALHRHQSLQRQIPYELLNYFGSSMLLQGRKSLDVLQGILVMTAWYPFHLQRNPQLMNVLHLAKALLIDLGLSRLPASLSLPIRTSARIHELLHGGGVATQHEPSAVCRLPLALYFAEAQIALTFRRLDYPRWTENLEERCRQLEQSIAASGPEPSRSDIKAVHFVRLHQVAGRYIALDGGCRPAPHHSSDPASSIAAFLCAFQQDLRALRAAVPDWLSAMPVFEMHVRNVEITVHDAAADAAGLAASATAAPTSTSNEANAAPTPASATTTPTPTSAATAAAAKRVEILHVLLELLEAGINHVLALPADELPSMTLLEWGQLEQATNVLAKVSFLRADGWDVVAARARLNLAAVAERLGDKFADMFLHERARFPSLDASRYAVSVLKLRQCRRWFEDRVAAEAAAAGSGMAAGDAGDAAALPSLAPADSPAGDLWAADFGDPLGDALWQFQTDDGQW